LVWQNHMAWTQGPQGARASEARVREGRVVGGEGGGSAKGEAVVACLVDVEVRGGGGIPPPPPVAVDGKAFTKIISGLANQRRRASSSFCCSER
jgi:hypothetical protein